MVESEAEVRDDWWHIILFLPISIFIYRIFGLNPITALLFFTTLICYPIAYRKDAQWVNGTTSEWQPNPNLYTVLGIGVVLTFGALSFIFTPIHMYNRWKYIR